MLDPGATCRQSGGVNRAISSDRVSFASFVALPLTLLCAAQTFAHAQTDVFLDDSRCGHWLAQTKDLGVWWCESGWKVGRERGLPEKPHRRPGPVTLSAARGEYRAGRRWSCGRRRMGSCCRRRRARCTRAGARVAHMTVQMDEVAYVQVTHPTDKLGTPGLVSGPAAAAAIAAGAPRQGRTSRSG